MMSDFPKLDKLVEECDPTLKLAITAWVMKHIVDHAREGGSYRYLIYNRLGFSTDAYVPLCDNGITISNEFDLNLKDNVIEAYKSKDEKKLKQALGLCDEPDCFSYISCGWPSDAGYRTTCGNHYEGKLKKDV
jgi:hypothetical protein